MTTKIQLTRGLFTIVDDEDAELSTSTWFAQPSKRTCYAGRTVMGKNGRKSTQRLHRVIWSRMHPGTDLPKQIDHRDGDGLNCRRANLRVATVQESCQNRRLRSDNDSGFKGVNWHKKSCCWHARIGVDGKRQHLGQFDSAEKAALAYDVMARKCHREFATLNFPEAGELAAQRGIKL